MAAHTLRRSHAFFLQTVRLLSVLCLCTARAGAVKLRGQDDAPAPSTPSFNNPEGTSVYSVLQYGAKGDGSRDDSAAILKALSAACTGAKAGKGAAVVLLPAAKTFLSKSVIEFSGPCGSSSFTFQVNGKLIFGKNIKGSSAKGLLHFSSFKGFRISGSGSLDGSGATWWGLSTSKRAQLILIDGSSNVDVGGITTINPPKCHLTVSKSTHVWIHKITTNAPADSPNTDSIHISNCQDVLIEKNTIFSGDDCVSIVGSTSNVVLDGNTCNAGHGYSIGSLGYGGNTVCLRNITVQNSVLSGTTNGLRIKTYQGGSGAVTGVTYKNIQMKNVKHPIILDQFYCDKGTCTESSSNIALNNIAFYNIFGTTIDKSANGGVYLSCSTSSPCTNLFFSDLGITSTSGKALSPLVQNAFGRTQGPLAPPFRLPAVTAKISSIKAQTAKCGWTPKF